MSTTQEMARVVIRCFADRKWTLGLAESCSGGRLATFLTDVPGASAVIVGSIVAYQDTAKETLLHVSSKLLAEQRTVSQECAEQMAQGALDAFGSHAAVAITGTCGPSALDPHSAIGEVWLTVAWPSITEQGKPILHSQHRIFEGERQVIAGNAARWALEELVLLGGGSVCAS